MEMERRKKSWNAVDSGPHVNPAKSANITIRHRVASKISSDDILWNLRKANENFFRAFPNCRFGNKCLFIHPNCKYDAKCKNPACAFTHSSARPAGFTTPAAPSFAPPRK